MSKVEMGIRYMNCVAGLAQSPKLASHSRHCMDLSRSQLFWRPFIHHEATHLHNEAMHGYFVGTDYFAMACYGF